jgi:hypothetical protein
MEMSFRKYLMEMNVPGPHLDGGGGAYVTSDQSGSETWKNTSPYLPSYELTAQVAPHDIVYGRVAQVKEYQPPKKTLVNIRLETPRGRQENIYLNTDQYRLAQRINAGRKPNVGDMMSVPFLRLPGDYKSKSTIMGMRY